MCLKCKIILLFFFSPASLDQFFGWWKKFTLNCNFLKNNKKNSFVSGESTCLQPLGRTYTNKYVYSYRSKMLSPTGTMCYEIVFLPLVHLQTDLPVQMNDRLQCFSDLQGFTQSCPELRPKSQSTNVSCDPLLTNRDCGFLENGHGSRCSTSQTCDYVSIFLIV